MKAHRIAMGILGALVCKLGAEARADSSLADQLNFLYGDFGIKLTEQEQTSPPGVTIPHTAHFTSESLATLGLLVQTLAPATADFPAISTVPGLSYRYNPDLQAFERSSGSLGPVYVERPQTVGRGKLDIGIAYLHIDFDELNGDELDGLAFRGLKHNDCCPPGGAGTTPGVPAFEQDTADLFFDQFGIESDVVSLFATYGITDDWDVNILLPIIHTSLEVNARAELNNESGTDTHEFGVVDGVRVTEDRRSIDDSKTGVGDLQLRTKYHLLSRNGFNLASGLNLRLPTGDEDDFQGLGDTTLTPFFSVAQEYGRFDFHLAAGVEINADDTERSRVRYAAGVTAGIIEPLAFLVDVIGNSNVTDQELSVTVPTEGGTPGILNGPDRTETRELRTDVVDLALGFKAAFPYSLVGFAGVFVPLNDDGLRADVIPTANIEVSF
ncbi:MAG: transporter [Pseudomonadota bacterium]|nr:transporter [Pseudomonadota bacterium]